MFKKLGILLSMVFLFGASSSTAQRRISATQSDRVGGVGGEVGDRVSASNFPIEDAVTCSSDPTATSGIELNFLASKGLVRISEWSRSGRTDLKSYLSVLENPGPSDHNIDIMAGDFKNYFFMRSGRHKHVVEVLVSQAVLGGGDTASGAIVSKGLAVVTDVEGITEEELKTKYSLSCSDQP